MSGDEYKLTKEEQETIIIYNNAEDEAVVSTYDKALINAIDSKLGDFSSVITVVKRGEGFAEYTCPKKWVKVKFPRLIPIEMREKLRDQMLSINAKKWGE